MSRPPRPESSRPLRTDLSPRDGRLDYFPLDFDDLVALAADVGGALAPDQRDPTATLYELSALVAHVLGVHQDHFASEAFLRTASTARSLVKHGRRLGYEPAPGSTATGYLSIDVKRQLQGDLPVAVVAATSPVGGAPAEEFETATARKVDARWNRLAVRDRMQRRVIPATARELRVVGTSLGFRAGEPAILTGPGDWRRIEIAAVTEDSGVTVLALAAELGVTIGVTDDPADYTIRSRPAVDVRPFGWNADASLFPPDQLETATDYTAPTTLDASTQPTYGYQVTSATGAATTAATELFLAQALADTLVGDFLLVSRPSGSAVLRVGPAPADMVDAAVRFVRGGARQVVTSVDPHSGTPSYGYVLDERAITATVTRLHASDRSNTAQTRSDIDVHARMFGKWRTSAPLVGLEASTVTIGPDQDLFLDGQQDGLEPGMAVALSTADGALAQVVELTEVAVQGDATRIRYKERTPLPEDPDGSIHVWRLGNLVVLGNVVAVIHGTTRDEVLGESDGVTPFQRFKLKKAPLSHVPSGDGVTPDLEVRVGGVRWDRVSDFGVPEPDSNGRQYKLERDDTGATWVLFADGRFAAVPPAGDNNVTAHYRVGLGVEGNVDAGRINRLIRSHPLIDRVTNPVATGGGTEPASPDDVRRQATRYIRTFDRAVSIGDHADLALLFPGVARASARLADGAIELVAATAEGEPVPNSQLLLDFLDARRDTELRLVPIAPQPVPVAIQVYIEVDDAYLPRVVEAAVRDALFGTDPDHPGMFTFAARDLGQAAFASEVYSALTRVPGVTFAQLITFDLANPGTRLEDVLQPQPHQWLRVDATTFSFAPQQEADNG
jgi:hypothetical protein